MNKSDVASDSNPNSLKGTFYSVFIPGEIRPQGSEICKNIFNDKNEALQMVKKSKKARFKHFNYFHEAVKFAINGVVEQSRRENSEFTETVLAGEKAPFKTPKPQDLVELRKAIEKGNLEFVRRTIWENPRYLVSSGDTPSIVQEGSRYNALHVAAKAKNGAIAELILDTISDENFIKLLYGNDNYENVERRIEMLLDLYLNMPDKGMNETPLHFAVKFGALSVVEVLVSFAQCDKTLKNKFNKTADMIICDRCDNSESVREMKRKMSLLLGNFYYVPVLRAEDNSLAPVIGEPFSPGHAPVLNQDPLSPRLEIRAYAGPMNKEGADQFRKVWKTPPRTNSFHTSTPVKSEIDGSVKFTDPEKGLERFGQKLASKYDVTWKEYWPFLDSFIDITSMEGLNLLEKYLREICLNLSKSNVEKSSITDLCDAFNACNLSDASMDDKDDFPILCVDKTCDVFATRITNHLLRNNLNFDLNGTVSLLKNDIKKLEQLICSYKDDKRFSIVDFQLVHYRIGKLVADKIKSVVISDEKIKQFIRDCSNSLDWFSSDDESNGINETSYKTQLVCLFKNIDNHLNTPLISELNMRVLEIWQQLKQCRCIFQSKKTWKVHRFKRKLFTDLHNNIKYESSSSSSSDDEFFTPPNSPRLLSDSEDDDFKDVEFSYGIFIEGGLQPTKMDCAVYNALALQNCIVDPNVYPYIYRWRHSISLYSKLERDSWAKSDRFGVTHKNADLNQSFNNNNNCTPPSKAWLRITGASSPRVSHKK